MTTVAEASHFLYTQARPLEAALYAFEFEGGDRTTAIRALAAFQNEDGGFGSALEPDIRMAGSSVIATTTAFLHFRTLKLTDTHEMVQKASAYLIAQYVEAEARWPIIPANIDDAPHAPWWEYGGGLWASKANPTAEILGYLYEYPAGFSETLREQVSKAVLAYLDTIEGAPEMHDLICLIALIENPAIPEQLRAAALPKVRALADVAVERDPEGWKAYGLPPLGLIDSPQSRLAAQFADILPKNLDFVESGRTPGGGWEPNWDWGYLPEVWALAKRDWAGVLTLRNLRILRAFGRT